MVGENLFSLGLAMMMGFFSGAVPFSLIIGRLFLGEDVRRYGDGNPGAVNAWRAGGWKTGVPALLLDFLKGAMPVGWMHFDLGFSSWELAGLALMPILGHAFSPFLRFRGGKAVAVTFGVWSGLTLWEAPTALGAALVVALLLHFNDAWAVMFGMSVLLLYVLLREASWSIFALWLGNSLILWWKHRHELSRLPLFRASPNPPKARNE